MTSTIATKYRVNPWLVFTPSSQSEFAGDARHFLFPNAFTRSCKLPLPSLIAALLSMREASQQVMLDSLFGSLGDDGDLRCGIIDRRFAEACDRLSWNALQRLKTFVV